MAIKVLNAQHWSLGAQEYERLRLLWKGLYRRGATGASILEPRCHFEEGVRAAMRRRCVCAALAPHTRRLFTPQHARLLQCQAHFCIVFPLLSPLRALAPQPMAPLAHLLHRSQPLSSKPHGPQPTLCHALHHPSAPPLAGILCCGDNGPSILGSVSASACSFGLDGCTTEATCPKLSVDALRQAAAQLLGALTCMHEQQLLHADLKPDNLLVRSHAVAAVRALGADVIGGRQKDTGGCIVEISTRRPASSMNPGRGVTAAADDAGAGVARSFGAWLGDNVVLTDFSNAMGIREVSAYYDTFEVTTLAYRAPEVRLTLGKNQDAPQNGPDLVVPHTTQVLYGLSFDVAIDMWSLGATLAELYAGRVLMHATSRGALAVQQANLLGRPPAQLYARGQYASELLPLTSNMPEGGPRSLADVRYRLGIELQAPLGSIAHQQLLDLLARLLVYDPAQRPSARGALRHPFFAPILPFASLLPPDVMDCCEVSTAHTSSGKALHTGSHGVTDRRDQGWARAPGFW